MKNLSDTKAKAKAGNQTQDDVVYCHIFDAILEQRLPPKTKLNEESLSEIFGVSRTIIRRALLRLSLEQVVTITPNKGAAVAAPSIEQAKQILTAREVAEITITELAVDNYTPKLMQQMRDLVIAEQDAYTQGDIGRGIRLSGEFHMVLAQMADNAPLTQFMRSLVSQTSLLIAQYEGSNNSNCSEDEHTQLLDSIEAGHKEQAIAQMKHHLGHIRQNLDLSESSQNHDLRAVFSDFIHKKQQDKPLNKQAFAQKNN